MPPTFDAVIMIEDTWQEGEKYLIRKSAAPWQHIRPAGEDIFENRLVLPRGHRIRAFDIGALATYGIVRINARTVNVGIIPPVPNLSPFVYARLPARLSRATRSWHRYFSKRWEHTVPACLLSAMTLKK